MILVLKIMKKHHNKFLLIIALVLVSALSALFITRSTDWWTHPHVSGEIKQIIFYSGSIRVPDEKPSMILNHPSMAIDDFVSLIENAQLYRRGVKFASVVELDIRYEDGSADYLRVGERFIAFYPSGSDRILTYKLSSKDGRLIRNLLAETIQQTKSESNDLSN